MPTEKSGLSYRGLAGDKQSLGNTPGEALDALTPQLTDDGTGLLVVVQSLRPDRFFGAEQQRRLAELMGHWRTAQDQGKSLSPAQQAELDALVEAELRASVDRAAVFANDLP